MGGFLKIVESLSKGMNYVSAAALTFIMLLTVADVSLRLLGRPIVGTYEIVGLAGAVVIGFAAPITSWMRAHIYVDFVINGLAHRARDWFNIGTRLVNVALFILIGWNLFRFGFSLYSAGEVTLTRHLPIHPIVYGLGVCCFIQCVVLMADIVKIARGAYE